ncbi:iron-sulfur cluster assembly accessory protein [Brachybacterium phenoliresistens]|uniref:Iron-sulfur cluster assembly accessory protein n=1 Tax=Brachybacterium phenoliresistens TaxID=396014 RepID=Z9JUB7_9MICO|nr:iron-sulfur cluster assembly accessory protein [Brachybacterium phenoliresistens]
MLPPFTVTRAAVAQIVALGGAVHIGLGSGGCCGTVYAYAVLENPAEASGAALFGCPGAWLLVAPEALDVLTGSTLDYSARIRPPRFRVLRNPRTEHVCPCRRSFGTAWPGAGSASCRSYEPMPWDAEFEPPQRWVKQTGWRRASAEGER